MLLLLGTMIVSGVVALALGIAGLREVGPVAVVAEVVMLIAMVDVHVPALGLLPAPFWALLLGGCAVGTALVDRLRRSRRPGGDHLHALGMLLGAVFVLFSGAGTGVGVGVGVHGGTHAGHGVSLLLPIGVAVVVHVGVVARAVVRARGSRTSGADSVRRVASLVGVLAMGGMALVH